MAERAHEDHATPGASGDAKDAGKDVQSVGGKTATSTPAPGESKSASPDMKDMPADTADKNG